MVRRRKTQPAGSKRKGPEPDTRKPSGSERETLDGHAGSPGETIRELDEALEAIASRTQQRSGADGDGDSCDGEQQDGVRMD
ncbi:hypothetical protein E2562_021220 [Oryza meyeriana var. granulata]|uniref:Uncharacterized protein n=1 Tax=Oryza meyeriana var. granulata TaxID=110450 RepID=A0A6G1DYY1_9ORYZ|nr:hypothetical protein E2562_021220 [Oryza meyeriana var. granulata]